MVPPPLKRLPERLLKGLQHPSVVVMTVRFGTKVGHEAYLLHTKEIDYKEFKRRTIQGIGEISGTTLGAAIGGLAGSWVPGVGALVGAFLGSMCGEYVGRKSAGRVHKVLRSDEQQKKQDPPNPLGLSGREL